MDASITRRGGADRSNTKLAAAVDETLAILEQKARKASADHLMKHGASFALTCRVLTQPQQRRPVLVNEEASN